MAANTVNLQSHKAEHSIKFAIFCAEEEILFFCGFGIVLKIP